MPPLRNFKRFFFKALSQPGYAIGVFFRRVRAYFSYFFVKGFASPPESITLFLTHRCNLRCKMCGQWGEGGVTKKEGGEILKEELSFQQYKKVLDDLAKIDRPSITLFGGEPLLYPDCPELIRYIKSKKMHCLMITNGSLLSSAAASIVEAGLDELNISLDGDCELHDQIRGLPGLFDRIMDGIEQVNKHKARLKRTKPLINLQCTITKYNYRYLERMLNVARAAKANSLTFHNLIFLDPAALDRQKAFDRELESSSRDWQGFIFDPEVEARVLWVKIKQIFSAEHSFKVDFYTNFSEAELDSYYRKADYQPPAQNCRCLSPWLVAYVFPDGQVRPCLNFNYSFGNVLETDFFAVWNSEKARKFREMLKFNRIFPACVRCTELYRY
jgi:radical SAM protein with 4Fe4S-binding SPASM domain